MKIEIKAYVDQISSSGRPDGRPTAHTVRMVTFSDGFNSGKTIELAISGRDTDVLFAAAHEDPPAMLRITIETIDKDVLCPHCSKSQREWPARVADDGRKRLFCKSCKRWHEA